MLDCQVGRGGRASGTLGVGELVGQADAGGLAALEAFGETSLDPSATLRDEPLETAERGELDDGEAISVASRAVAAGGDFRPGLRLHTRVIGTMGSDLEVSNERKKMVGCGTAGRPLRSETWPSARWPCSRGGIAPGATLRGGVWELVDATDAGALPTSKAVLHASSDANASLGHVPLEGIQADELGDGEAVPFAKCVMAPGGDLQPVLHCTCHRHEGANLEG